MQPRGKGAAVTLIADIAALLHVTSMDTTFDGTWNRAFKGTPYRLRFELGGEDFSCVGAPVPRFVQALTRAREVREAVFANSARVWAITVSMADTRNDVYSLCSDSFMALSSLGFRCDVVAEWRAQFDPDDLEQDEEFIWRSFDVTADISGRDTLLWSSLTYEMPIQPKSSIMAYLVDFEREIMLHVYDDRGMDVSALTADALQSVYKHFDGWLLDYDRERMRAAFA